MANTISLELATIKNNFNDDKTYIVRKDVLSNTVALNFRVPAEFKKNFKIAAATYGLKQSELLQQLFSEWLKQQDKDK